ncbi:MAG: metallophosphoesterase [Candidatus Heimdallarchaeota archaeon]|nr:metallophosphoesterase [Candidatus Heimdallarchaeota archaeon]
MRKILIIILLISLSPNISNVGASEELQYPSNFDIIVHPNRNISYPHSSYPALTAVGANLKVETLQEYSFTFALGNRSHVIPVQQDGNQITIPEITEGMYDLLAFDGNECVDVQTHAVKVYAEMPDTITFVQITDTHLPLFTEDQPTTEIISSIFENITLEAPDFVLLTGDFLEMTATLMKNETTNEPPLFTVYELMEIGLSFLDLWQLPIFVIPGNHDWSNYYPDMVNSKNIWMQYYAPYFVQSFDLGPVSFIGYGSGLGITDNELDEIQQVADNTNKPFKILYTHNDYNRKIRDHQFDLGISMVVYGHTHSNSLEFIDHVLWVETSNAYEPWDTLNGKGYRVISINSSFSANVDGIDYNFIDPNTITTFSTQSNTQLDNTTSAKESSDQADTILGRIYLALLPLILIKRKYIEKDKI